MLRTFRIVRGLATVPLLVAVMLGLVMVATLPGLGAFWLGTMSSLVCVLILIGLWADG